MNKTKLIALALAVVMAFSVISVSAFAAYTPLTKSARDEKLAAVGATNIYYNDISNLTLTGGSTNKVQYTFTPAGWSENKNSSYFSDVSIRRPFYSSSSYYNTSSRDCQ